MLPERYARRYLERAPSLVWLLGANLLAVLVGTRYYVETMPEVHTFLWPLYLDSAVAVGLMALSLCTLLPFIGDPIARVPTNRAVAYLHTIAFVWLVKFGLWTIAVLLVGWSAYFPAVWGFFGIILTHLLFVGEAYLIPHYGRTTPGALATALGLALLNDLVDYGFGVHPPLQYDPGPAVPLISISLSLVAVALALHAFPPLESD